MVASTSPVRESAVPHIHIAGENCPWCDQLIPREKFAEITGRIEARERERFADITRTVKEQHAREKAQAEARPKPTWRKSARRAPAKLSASRPKAPPRRRRLAPKKKKPRKAVRRRASPPPTRPSTQPSRPARN